MASLTDFEIGYTFQNYSAPANEWGTVLTADDMRYTYLDGIELTLTDGREVKDVQLEYFAELAMAEFERFLDVVIRKRIYRTNYTGADVRKPKWKTTADLWTHIEDPYAFIRRQWENMGYVQLRHRPIISVERFILKTPTDQSLIDLKGNSWVRLDKGAGNVHLFPKAGSTTLYGPYLGSAGLILERLRGDYFDAFEVDYTAGYENSDFVPEDLRAVIGELGAIGILNWVGDGLLAGFSSSSVSLDGLSESFSSTQSATSAYFGARIKEYRDHIKNWLKSNGMKYRGSFFAVA